MELFEYRSIQEPSLFDYLNKVIEASKDGYTLSEDNDKFPQNLFTVYTVTMVKPYGKPKEVQEEEVKTAVKRTKKVQE